MAIFFILMCIILLLLIIITQEIDIRISKDERLVIEFHLALFAICLTQRVGKRNENLPLRFYSRLARRITDLSTVSEITINPIFLSDHNEQKSIAFTRTYRYATVISAIIAHLSSSSKKINIPDNIFLLTPDGNTPLSFSLSIKTRLFYIIPVISSLALGIMKIKSERKEKENVGN